MRRMDFVRFRSVRLPIGSGSLLLLFFSSAFGILLGYRFAVGAQPFLASELAGHFAAYAADGEIASAATVLHTFFSFLRAPMFAFLLGFSLPGVLLLPLLCAFESFSLSFSYFSFVSAVPGNFGRVLLLFSGRIFLIFPSLLLLASFSWEASRTLLASGGGKRMIPAVYGAAYWIRAAVCTAILLLGAAAELWLIPVLFRSALF